MSVLILNSGNIGPFKNIEILDDRLRCDNTDYPFNVIGEYSISGDDNLAPARTKYSSLEEARTARLDELAAYRNEKETAGITVNGAIIKTDLESQAMINGAVAYSNLNPELLIDWKAANGWVQIGHDDIIAIGQAVGAHVQACFSKEKVHAAAINALSTKEVPSIAEIEAYDFTVGWP